MYANLVHFIDKSMAIFGGKNSAATLTATISVLGEKQWVCQDSGIPDLPVPLAKTLAFSDDGKLTVCGGVDDAVIEVPLSACYALDLEAEQRAWQPDGSLTLPYIGDHAHVYDGQAHLIGALGVSGQVMDLASGVWSPSAAPAYPFAEFASCSSGGSIFVIGGTSVGGITYVGG